MTVQILYKNKDNSNNEVFFLGENFNINDLKKHVSSSDLLYIKEILKNNNLKKKILSFDLNSKKKLILIAVKQKLENSNVENLGAELYNYIKNNELLFNDNLNNIVELISLSDNQFKPNLIVKETWYNKLDVFLKSMIF